MKKTKGLTQKQQTLFDSLTRLQQGTCIGVLAGLSGTEAYKRAGGKAKSNRSAESASSTMLRKVEVKAFLDSVRNDLVGETIISRNEVLVRLTALARFNITDAMEASDDGWKFKDPSQLTEDQIYCIQDFINNKDEGKIKRHSVFEAMKQLRAMQGWDAAEKHVLTNKAGEDVLPDAHELAKRMLFLINMGVLAAERKNHKII